MSNKKLDNYTKALLAEQAFMAKHNEVFDHVNSLRVKIADAGAELKKEVRENLKTNIANDIIKVTYSPAFSKYYDFDVIMKMITPKQKKALEASKAITHALDKGIFEDLVEKGVIPIEIKQEAFRETELAPRISIKEQKHE